MTNGNRNGVVLVVQVVSRKRTIEHYREHRFAVLMIKHSKVCGCLPMPPESHEGDLKPSKIEYLCPDNKRLILMAMTIITVRLTKWQQKYYNQKPCRSYILGCNRRSGTCRAKCKVRIDGRYEIG